MERAHGAVPRASSPPRVMGLAGVWTARDSGEKHGGGAAREGRESWWQEDSEFKEGKMSQELVVRKGMVHGVMTGKSQPKKHMVRGCWRRWVGGDGTGEARRGCVQEPGLGDTPGAEVQLVHGALWTKPHGAHPRSPSGVPVIARGAAHSGRAGHGCWGPGKS